MAGRRNCSLFCAPQPIARLVQVFPKLAIVFFLIHMTVIIYSFFSPNPHAVKSKEGPPGVLDDKMKFIGIEKDHRIQTNLNISAKKIIRFEKDAISSRKNNTKSLLLKKIKPDGLHGNRDGHDSNKHPNIQKRSPER